MEIQAHNNSYAQLLNKQGNYVINVAGVDWFDYSGFMTPAYLPHCCPVITPESAIEVLRESRRPFARWDTKFGQVQTGEWWYILKKGAWSIDDVKDKKKRWMIRQGKKNFKVRALTLKEVAVKCPKVAQLAAARYKGEAKVESEEMLVKRAGAANEVPGALEYMGCFYNDELVGFSENYIQNNAVWLATIRYDPAYLGRYSSYGFLDGILDYYLNEKKLLYVLDGCRNIYHKTDFQEHLVKVFGFTKEYALLNIVYRPGFEMGVKAACLFKGLIWNLNRRWANSTLDKVSGILRQEYITKACSQKTAPLSWEPKIIISSDTNQLHIRELMPKDVRQAAELHIKGIQTGFISTLGIDFVTALYEAIAASRLGFGFVAEKGGKIVGFVVFTVDIIGLYKSVILKHGLRFIFLLAGKVCSLKWLRNIFETILYPQRIRKISSLHTALLSIVVATEERGKGLASEMIRKGFSECQRRGIDKVRVLVGADNKPANGLYPKCGFKLVGQIKNHGVLSNVYEARTDHFGHH